MSRLVSCYTNCYGADGVHAAARCAREDGIAHLELALKPHDLGGLVIPESAIVGESADDATAAAFVAELAALGVGISGCNVGGGDLRTPEGEALTARRIRFSKRWFDVPVVVTGVGQPAEGAERAAVVAALGRLGDLAGSLGLTIALETHRGPTENADAMLRLIAEVDHPAVRLNFDTGNLLYYNRGADLLAELERVKHLVRNVHLKDSRGGFEEWYFPAIGDGGAVDFAGVRLVLDSAGFTGPYTIEIEGIDGEPEPGLAGRRDRVARSVAHLKACGYFDA